jgi:CHASE3 domain sensor protein
VRSFRWTIAGELAAALAGILLLMLGSTAISILALGQQGALYQGLANGLRVDQVRAAQLKAAVQGQAQNFRAFVIKRDPAAQERYEAHRQEAEKILAALADRAAEPEAERLLQGLRNVARRFDETSPRPCRSPQRSSPPWRSTSPRQTPEIARSSERAAGVARRLEGHIRRFRI